MKQLAEHAEDIALLLGALMSAIGIGLTFGLGLGMAVFGLLLVAYGVWITEKPRKDQE